MIIVNIDVMMAKRKISAGLPPICARSLMRMLVTIIKREAGIPLPETSATTRAR